MFRFTNIFAIDMGENTFFVIDTRIHHDDTFVVKQYIYANMPPDPGVSGEVSWAEIKTFMFTWG